MTILTHVHIFGVGVVILRLQTLQALFGGLLRYIPPVDREKALTRVGRAIGRSFAYTLADHCEKKGRQYDYDTFVRYWARADGKFGWGEISVVEVDNRRKQIILAVKDSFVRVKGHAYCPFMCGYIEGVLDEGFRYGYRWIDKEGWLRLPDWRAQVGRVDETPLDEACRFTVQLVEEKFVGCFDQLFECRRSVRAAGYKAAAGHLRSALEIGLNELVGITGANTVPPGIITRLIARDCALPDLAGRGQSVWHRLCDWDHRGHIPTEDEYLRCHEEVRDVLDDFFHVKVRETIRRRIVEKVRRIERQPSELRSHLTVLRDQDARLRAAGAGRPEIHECLAEQRDCLEMLCHSISRHRDELRIHEAKGELSGTEVEELGKLTQDEGNILDEIARISEELRAPDENATGA